MIIQYLTNAHSIFSGNTEAKASELLEHIKKMFPRYYIHSEYLPGLNLQLYNSI